ncbi:hypothetical protein [Paenibacillus whitsoniae]|uniref:Uncharacterized protein n=1 Tax=Paenibacillus whitsoniae TaxID=2496558 RepID=A0A3S0AB20_9BACL|nr:hypothetical protein [Paenibacillus whitsoniae]RTE08781.1 hypothetical protein EJQ19_14735 [Paenibacillus whitsoniae]
MNWSELQRVPHEYSDKLHQIDENLIRLLNERQSLAQGKRCMPEQDVVQAWAAQYGIDVPQINWLLSCLNHSLHPFMPSEPGELLQVLPIMKKTVLAGYEYAITHSMQHENGSMVHLEIKQLTTEEAVAHFRPQLQLDIISETPYAVFRHGASGGGGRSKLQFLVTPRLPEPLAHVHFALIPFAAPMELPPKEIILDQEVRFD